MHGALCYGSGIGGGFNGIEVQKRKTVPVHGGQWIPSPMSTATDQSQCCILSGEVSKRQ